MMCVTINSKQTFFLLCQQYIGKNLLKCYETSLSQGRNFLSHFMIINHNIIKAIFLLALILKIIECKKGTVYKYSLLSFLLKKQETKYLKLKLKNQFQIKTFLLFCPNLHSFYCWIFHLLEIFNPILIFITIHVVQRSWRWTSRICYMNTRK